MQTNHEAMLAIANAARDCADSIDHVTGEYDDYTVMAAAFEKIEHALGTLGLRVGHKRLEGVVSACGIPFQHTHIEGKTQWTLTRHYRHLNGGEIITGFVNGNEAKITINGETFAKARAECGHGMMNAICTGMMGAILKRKLRNCGIKEPTIADEYAAKAAAAEAEMDKENAE